MESLYGVGDAVAEAQRRFGGVARLYGEAALARFGAARVAVVGLGGVGTWAAEALARSGCARLTLIDLDHVAQSNTNRQIHALDPEFGKAKVIAMAGRITAINPLAQVRPVEEFVTPQNAASLLQELDLIIDCIDQVRAKAALIAHARLAGIDVITCGAAGGRRNPGRIQVEDLARTRGDALLSKVRQRLRRDHGFAAPGTRSRPARMGVAAVYSDEPPMPLAVCAPQDAAPGSPLACGGYGSAVTVTATMGLAAAAWALERLAAPPTAGRR